MYSSNAQPTGTNRPRACPNHVQNHTRFTYVTRTQRTHTPPHQGSSCSRPLRSSQPTNPGTHHATTGVGGVPSLRVVERVTAAIAKRETPGPIPNPEVKPFSADGTATERLWESRTPPDIHCESGVAFGRPRFCMSCPSPAGSTRGRARLARHLASTDGVVEPSSTGSPVGGRILSDGPVRVVRQEVHCGTDTDQEAGRRRGRGQ